jgi:hypothetical protein
MSPAFGALLSAALLSAFAICCTAACVLQIRAWSRHAREGVRPTLRALRDPAPYLLEAGARQLLLARRLLNLGALAYLLFGALHLLGPLG